MILLALALVGGASLGIARGGSLRRLAETRIRWPQLLFAALLVELALDFVAPRSFAGTPATRLVLVANLAVIVFLAANRSLPGMIIALVGLALNLTVIAANGAMPVSQEAADRAGVGQELDDPGFKHERLDDDTVLPWLGDVIPIPLSGSAVSVGDIILALGISRFVYAQTRVGSGDPARGEGAGASRGRSRSSG